MQSIWDNGVPVASNRYGPDSLATCQQISSSDWLPWIPPSCSQKAIVCVFSPGTNSERNEVPPRNTLTKVALQRAEPLWVWAPTWLRTAQPRGRHLMLIRSASRAQTKHWSTWSHGLCWIWDIRLQLHTPKISRTLELIWNNKFDTLEVKSYRASRHTRQFGGVGKVRLLQTWVSHVWLLAPEVSKKAILRHRWFSYQLF